MNTQKSTKAAIFSAPMVRATLAGHKTQTRRIVNRVARLGPVTDFGPSDTRGYDWTFRDRQCRWHDVRHAKLLTYCPYGRVGDLLRVRETWKYADWTEDGLPFIGYRADNAQRLIERIPDDWSDKLSNIWADLSDPANYAIDNRAADRRWRPAIHMPHWASRLALRITDVRVQRLHDISDDDVAAEGIEPIGNGCGMVDREKSRAYTTLHGAFATLWSDTYGIDSWNSNPVVWALSFEVLRPTLKT
jgi:hypothetical protein